MKDTYKFTTRTRQYVTNARKLFHLQVHSKSANNVDPNRYEMSKQDDFSYVLLLYFNSTLMLPEPFNRIKKLEVTIFTFIRI